jgi:NTP pyrophosphatase (non-canonical NTP hydrolase)
MNNHVGFPIPSELWNSIEQKEEVKIENNMTQREEALVILMEECGELTQACSKMIRSGGDTKYERQLQDEVGDVLALIEVLKISGIVTDKQIEDRMKVKKEKLMKWSMLYG